MPGHDFIAGLFGSKRRLRALKAALRQSHL